MNGCDPIDPGRAWFDAMRRNDFAAAWGVSDRVLAARDPATRDDPALPYHLRWVWDARAVDGRDVLVRCYHGLGDTIQFARYLPLLRARAASVTLEAQPALCGLLSQVAGVDRLIPFDPANPAPPSPCDLEIMELPHALRTPPPAPPYLTATPVDLPRGTIGVCGTTGEWDFARRIPTPALCDLAATRPSVSLSLGPTDLPVLNPEGCSADVAETARLVAACDLVITVDTMTAHLAGALGVPVWVLLKAEHDWRWPAPGLASAWYPRARMYRQPRTGDWTSVLAAVTRDLTRRAAPAHPGSR